VGDPLHIRSMHPVDLCAADLNAAPFPPERGRRDVIKSCGYAFIIGFFKKRKRLGTCDLLMIEVGVTAASFSSPEPRPQRPPGFASYSRSHAFCRTTLPTGDKNRRASTSIPDEGLPRSEESATRSQREPRPLELTAPVMLPLTARFTCPS